MNVSLVWSGKALEGDGRETINENVSGSGINKQRESG